MLYQFIRGLVVKDKILNPWNLSVIISLYSWYLYILNHFSRPWELSYVFTSSDPYIEQFLDHQNLDLVWTWLIHQRHKVLLGTVIAKSSFLVESHLWNLLNMKPVNKANLSVFFKTRNLGVSLTNELTRQLQPWGKELIVCRWLADKVTVSLAIGVTRDKSRNNQNDRDLSIVLYLDSYPRFLWSLWHSVQGTTAMAARPGRCEAFLWSMIMGGSDLTLSRWSGTISSPVSCLSAVWASLGCRWGIGAVLLGSRHCHSLGGVVSSCVRCLIGDRGGHCYDLGVSVI